MPAAHAVQTREVVATATSEYAPAAQATQAADDEARPPVTLYRPAPQPVQAAADARAEYVPAAQATHAAEELAPEAAE